MASTFLAKLIILQAQNRISTRRAAVLAYITNQLLRTFAAIKRVQAEQAADSPNYLQPFPAPGRLAPRKACARSTIITCATNVTSQERAKKPMLSIENHPLDTSALCD